MSLFVRLDHLDPAPWFTGNDEDNVTALMESIESHGLHNAIMVRPSGDRFEIGAGHDRTEAFRRLGKTEIPAHIRTAYTDEQWHSLFYRDNNERKPNADTKRQACRDAYTAHPEWSTRQVAAFAGCSNYLAHHVRSEMENEGMVLAANTIGRDGVEQPAKKPPREPKLPEKPAGPRDPCEHGVALDDPCADCGEPNEPEQDEPMQVSTNGQGHRTDTAAKYSPVTERQHQLAGGQRRRLVAGLSAVAGYCTGLADVDIGMALSAMDDDERSGLRERALESIRHLRRIANDISP